MTSLLGLIAPYKNIAIVGLLLAALGGGIWVYLALVHRAEQVQILTVANAGLVQANADGVKAVAAAQDQLKRTTNALAAELEHAADNATLSGQLKERISHAPKNGCVGDAQRAVLDGLRTDALNRRSQVPQPVTP